MVIQADKQKDGQAPGQSNSGEVHKAESIGPFDKARGLRSNK